MRPHANQFISQPNQQRPINKYDLRRQLYQAIENQFQHVPVPLKRKIQKLSNKQLEQAIDGIPMRDSIDSVVQLIQTMIDTGPPPPMREGDRPYHPKNRPFQSEYSSRREPGASPYRDDSPPPRRAFEVDVESEPDGNVSEIEAEPVERVEVAVTPQVVSPPLAEVVRLSAVLPSVAYPPHVAEATGLHRKGTVIPIQLEASVINLETALTVTANEHNQRGLQFQFQMGETEFISAQFIAQRAHIQSLESRVAKAVEGFFAEARHILDQI